MNFIIASNNRGKLKEFRDKFDINFIAYRDILGDIDIEDRVEIVLKRML